jgi:predicted nuclease with TOPRIM domain
MFDNIGISEVGGAVGAVAGSMYVAALGFRKLVKTWASEGVQISRSAAEKDIIESLRDEYERLAKHNSDLMAAMQTLQTEILNLHTSISSLRIENMNLKEEVRNLHAVIDQLKNLKGVKDVK